MWAGEADVQQKLTRAIQGYLPGVVPDAVYPSPVKGLYEVHIGPRVYYFSEDGRYLLEAQITDLKDRKDITEPAMRKARMRAMSKMTDDRVLVFSPKKPRYSVTVFTDIDCTYCRKMHSEIEEYNRLGIKVRYILYPRGRAGGASYTKAVSAWCAADRKQAFTLAKQGQDIPGKTCANPVLQNMRLGKLLGIRGTPTLYFEDGDLIASYIPPANLLKILQSNGKTQ